MSDIARRGQGVARHRVHLLRQQGRGAARGVRDVRGRQHDHDAGPGRHALRPGGPAVEGNRRYLEAYYENARLLAVVEQAATKDPYYRDLLDGPAVRSSSSGPSGGCVASSDRGHADRGLDPEIAGEALVRHGRELRPSADTCWAAGDRRRRRGAPLATALVARGDGGEGEPRMRFTEEHERSGRSCVTSSSRRSTRTSTSGRRAGIVPGPRAVPQAGGARAARAWSTTPRTAAWASTTASRVVLGEELGPLRRRRRPHGHHRAGRHGHAGAAPVRAAELKQRYLAPAISGERSPRSR